MGDGVVPAVLIIHAVESHGLHIWLYLHREDLTGWREESSGSDDERPPQWASGFAGPAAGLPRVPEVVERKPYQTPAPQTPRRAPGHGAARGAHARRAAGAAA